MGQTRIEADNSTRNEAFQRKAHTGDGHGDITDELLTRAGGWRLNDITQHTI